MSLSFTHRQVFLGLMLLALLSMLFARVYLQAMLGLEACPLCMTQRLFVVLWGAFALLAVLHNPGGWGLRVYAALCAGAAFVGSLVAARHVWLQHLPEDQVPACGPPLDYLLENFPLRDAINTMLMGDGNCAETVWTFMGLSIPEQTLLIFCVAIAVALWQLVRPLPAR
ncbi:MAG: disulfide bond formation protein B [Halioglobus sp.]|nr:disulfide bond formation protein B [Halioglobus sp.]